MNKNISDNKHEFNVRRVSELNDTILKLEEELKVTTGFFNSLKLRSELRRLYKQINVHGSEVLEYEYSRQLNSIH